MLLKLENHFQCRDCFKGRFAPDGQIECFERFEWTQACNVFKKVCWIKIGKTMNEIEDSDLRYIGHFEPDEI